MSAISADKSLSCAKTGNRNEVVNINIHRIRIFFSKILPFYTNGAKLMIKIKVKQNIARELKKVLPLPPQMRE
jgi:hypothetical protein